MKPPYSDVREIALFHGDSDQQQRIESTLLKKTGLILLVALVWSGLGQSTTAQVTPVAGVHGGGGKIDFSGYEGLAGGHIGLEFQISRVRLRTDLVADAFPFTAGILSVRTAIALSAVFGAGRLEPYAGFGFFGMYTEFEVPESLQPFADDSDYGVGNYVHAGLGFKATPHVIPFLELLASAGKSKGPSARLGIRYRL